MHSSKLNYTKDGFNVKSKRSAVHLYLLFIHRDAISKALYSRLFTWLVERINMIVCRSERDRSTSLAVLDIFGFEVKTH